MAGTTRFPNIFTAFPPIPDDEIYMMEDGTESTFSGWSEQSEPIHGLPPQPVGQPVRLTERNLAIVRATERATHWRQTQLAQQRSGQTAEPNEPMRYTDYVTYHNNVEDWIPSEPGLDLDSLPPSSTTYLTDSTDPSNSTFDSQGSTLLVDSDNSATLVESDPNLEFDDFASSSTSDHSSGATVYSLPSLNTSEENWANRASACYQPDGGPAYRTLASFVMGPYWNPEGRDP
ncbi:hypothetical protein F4805DRAFT_426081 [Annulohypoxylon moriforme]|nr:hypothetical protein F4805DRAFT_426081 [Annulohypoxylon moriforme]